MDKTELTLDEMLECAIREKGAKEHLQRLEAAQRLRSRRIRLFSFSAAASLVILAACTDFKFRSDARGVGDAFEFGAVRGASEITALMQDSQIREALARLADARIQLDDEMKNPVSDDPEYALQLETDMQELSLLEAVCYLRQGRYLKGRKALKAIRAAGGAFAEDADALLEQL